MRDKNSSFQPAKYKEKAHLDLMFLLIKQAFAIRYPNGQLIEIPVVNPEVSISTNCRQPLEGPQLPTANHLETIIQENVSYLYNFNYIGRKVSGRTS